MPSEFLHGIIIVPYFQNLQNYGIIKIHGGSILLNFLGLTPTHEFHFALNYAAQS